MPDITMCLGGECYKRHTCYRFLAEPTTYKTKEGAVKEYQAYFTDIHLKSPGDNCQYYWEVKSKNDIAYLNKTQQ